MSVVFLTPKTSEQVIDALLGTYSWKDTTLTYSFPGADSLWSTDPVYGYGDPNGTGEPWTGWFMPLSSTEAASFQQILARWSEVTNVDFIPVEDSDEVTGIIRVARTYLAEEGDAHAWAYYPSDADCAGDVWINIQEDSGTTPWDNGSYEFFAVMHEMGHVLGLKHPFEGDVVVPANLDAQSWTIMSYSALAGDEDSSFSFYPTTPMILDIAAVQSVYGPNLEFHADDTTYVFTDEQTYHQTIWDAGGSDTLWYQGSLDAALDLRCLHGSTIGQPVFAMSPNSPEQTRVNNVWIAHEAVIEHAVGGIRNDILVGNAVNNWLDGGAGLDRVQADGERARYQLANAGDSWVLSDTWGQEGMDSLVRVERVQFTDGCAALDLDVGGAARQAALVLGAVAYDLLQDPAVVGNVLGWVDGGMNARQIFDMALAGGEIQVLAGSGDDADLVRLAARNVLGQEPAAELVQELLGLLAGHGGSMTAADFLVMASEHPANLEHVAMLGVQDTGLVYV